MTMTRDKIEELKQRISLYACAQVAGREDEAEKVFEEIEEDLRALAERALNTSPVALSEYDARKPMSPALQALTESGQAEDGDADLVEPQGPTRVAAQLNMSITPDAYIGAREDMGIWKKRALEAEESNRALMASINGPIFMGDPLLPSVGNLPQHSLEPQGQALPELPEPDGYIGMTAVGSVVVPPSNYGKHNAYAVFTADQMRAYGRKCASQLALPAWTFQQRVQPWMMACFGETISNDLVERNHRFLEEALELVQSTGCTQSEAHQLVDYVFGRPVGEPAQEVGGVMVTLAALCLAAKMDMHTAGETELARIWTKVEQIRAKQAAKPKHSPLPVALPAGPVPEGCVLVPMHLSAEMRDVLSEEDWTWEDLLVAANAVTEEQYYAIQSGDGESPAVAQPVAQDRSQIQRLKDAIEGECAGLAIDDKQATTILQHVGAVAQPVEIDPHAVELAKKYAFPGALYPKEAAAQPVPEIVSDLRHSAKVDGYTEAQAKFINSIADRLASPALAHPVADEREGGPTGRTYPAGYRTPSVAQEQDAIAAALDEREDPIRQLIALHADELEGNDYAYFELARHRRTDWMAWICTNVIDSDPNRKVLAQGQGATPDEACAAAIADYRARAALCQPAEEGGKS